MADGDRFDSIKADLNQALEGRIGHLLGVVRAAQSLTRQIVAAEDELRRQTRTKEQLESEGSRPSASADLPRRLDAAKADLSRQRTLRDELLSQLAGLREAGFGDE